MRFTGEVKDLSFKGLGVIKHPDGRVFFSKGVWPGEKGEFEEVESKKRYGFARALEIENPSPDRRKAPCTHQGSEAGKCGGCPWMGLEYKAQLEAKQKMVSNSLARIGVPHDAIQNIWSSPEFGFRNHAHFQKVGSHLGFQTEGTNTFAPIDHCMILDSDVQDQLSSLKDNIAGDDRSMSIDVTRDRFSIGGRIEFEQRNTVQNARMKGWLKEQVSDLSPAPFLELFCGSGNFTDTLVESGFTEIFAVESNRSATESLERRHPNINTATLNLFEVTAWKLVKKFAKTANYLLLDPPRSGFSNVGHFVKMMKELEEIFYISCDLGTATRDLRSIAGQGFAIQAVQPVDLFPHTPHVEILVRLTKTATSN